MADKARAAIGQYRAAHQRRVPLHRIGGTRDQRIQGRFTNGGGAVGQQRGNRRRIGGGGNSVGDGFRQAAPMRDGGGGGRGGCCRQQRQQIVGIQQRGQADRRLADGHRAVMRQSQYQLARRARQVLHHIGDRRAHAYSLVLHQLGQHGHRLQLPKIALLQLQAWQQIGQLARQQRAHALVPVARQHAVHLFGRAHIHRHGSAHRHGRIARQGQQRIRRSFRIGP
jgi:hypothetical protein